MPSSPFYLSRTKRSLYLSRHGSLYLIANVLATNSASASGGITQYSIFRFVMPLFLTYGGPFRN
jgi:hypothetical protein